MSFLYTARARSWWYVRKGELMQSVNLEDGRIEVKGDDVLHFTLIILVVRCAGLELRETARPNSY